MITTVTLNPAIDREYFVKNNTPGYHQYIYENQQINVSPGGKGLVSAIDLKYLGYSDVQNIGFVGGQQGLFFEKMVQEYKITTNYIYTEEEMRNNIYIIGKEPVTYTHYNDYTYRVESSDVERLLKRFKRSITDSDLIIISGSIPEGVSFSIYQDLISICQQKGKKVYLFASGKALNRALQESPHFVVPYFKHSNKILEEKVELLEDYIRVGKKLQEMGVKHVSIPFHGKRLIFGENKVYSISAEYFRLMNWLGAGEAYNAAFFDHMLREGFDIIETNRYAGAAALAVSEKKEVFLKSRSEIEDKLELINIKEVTL
ncbi:1-phosphofructokinase family hexose kinase [Acetohalobium arabaticum]|uniref:Tagatose-6-phosphate kinase n=1 Tax=Acetohalobium arabaticum (strain ATCC 49924 / DSM 5501 / Z-7288) TaxID=574087 RepID=D9QUT4_ACEAZ|nr:PfkB family carbohydrate kinase [Acetohalobium arabaticum]ADL11993.1 PfkB domain protein [Acetohalobium arabaticum DSM 5501]